MSGANKWPIKDKKVEVEVAVVAEGNNNMLNNDGNDGVVIDGDGPTTDITSSAGSASAVVAAAIVDNSTTVMDNETEEVVNELEDEDECQKKQQEVDGGDGGGHKENSSHDNNDDNNPNDRNDDDNNNCGHGDSLSPVPLRHRLPELRQAAAVDEDTTGVTVVATVPANEVDDVLLGNNEGDNRAPGAALLAAVRTPPFAMPSPSAKPRTPGILRLDTSGKKSRRSSGISSTVEFRNDPEMLGEVNLTFIYS